MKHVEMNCWAVQSDVIWNFYGGAPAAGGLHTQTAGVHTGTKTEFANFYCNCWRDTCTARLT